MQSILGNTRKADITFYASGRIDISARVAKHLQLSRGDVLDIMIHQADFVQQFSKNVKQQLKQDYV